MIKSENVKNEDDDKIGDDCAIINKNNANHEKIEVLRFSSDDNER